MGFYEFLGMGTLGASAVITCDDSNESTEDCAPRAMSLARTLTENGFILSLLRQRRLSEELSHPTSGVEASNQRALNDSETSLNQASGGDLQSLIAGEPMDLSSGQRAIEQLREFEAGLETLIANLWSNYNTQFERYEAHYSDDRRALRNIALVRNKISMLEHTIRTQFIADATRITQQAMRSSRFTCNSANEVSNELAPEDEVSSENAQ